MSRVLLIGSNYFDYVAEIRAAFERLGHSCDYHPIETTRAKWARNYARPLYRRIVDASHRRIISRTSDTRYDHVVFIQCHQFSHENMAALRASQPQARFVLYNWDSLATHDYRPWLRHFDAVKTFDPDDAGALKIDYLPLFAVPRFLQAGTYPADIDLYFVGSLVTMERFDALEILHRHADANGLRLYYHLKCSPRTMLKLRKLGRWLPGITLRSLGFDQIVGVMRRSRATFDFANHRQSGYTMRFIENMCAGRKIVTENPRVLDEPFYRPDRFLVIANHDYSALTDFLDRPITSHVDTAQYSVDSWARQLLTR